MKISLRLHFNHHPLQNVIWNVSILDYIVYITGVFRFQSIWLDQCTNIIHMIVHPILKGCVSLLLQDTQTLRLWHLLFNSPLFEEGETSMTTIWSIMDDDLDVGDRFLQSSSCSDENIANWCVLLYTCKTLKYILPKIQERQKTIMTNYILISKF